MKNILLLIGMSLPLWAFAHGGGETKLHLDDQYESCSLQFASELTQAQYSRFVKEAGLLIHFKSLSSATTLGKGGVEFGISQSYTPIDDLHPAWNNTFSHPDSAHYLGNVAIPMLYAKYGISDRIDLGAYFTKDVQSNYGFLGVSLKYAMTIDSIHGYAMAARISQVHMLGVEDANLTNTSLEWMLSKKFGFVNPYVSAGMVHISSREHTDVVVLENESQWHPQLSAGLDMQWKFLTVGGQVDLSQVQSYSFKIGARF